MKTILDREREAVQRILVALEDLPLNRQRDVIWRLARLYGRPRRRSRRARQQLRAKGPSKKKGPFLWQRSFLFRRRALADAA